MHLKIEIIFICSMIIVAISIVLKNNYFSDSAQTANLNATNIYEAMPNIKSHTSHEKTNVLTYHDVASRIVQQSISNYSGQCPCPFSSTNDGRSCGGRSAWSQKSVNPPLCFEAEVTIDMIDRWKAIHPEIIVVSSK